MYSTGYHQTVITHRTPAVITIAALDEGILLLLLQTQKLPQHEGRIYGCLHGYTGIRTIHATKHALDAAVLIEQGWPCP